MNIFFIFISLLNLIRFAKLEKHEAPAIADFKANLKSTGKDKFALEEEKDEKVDFREQLKSAKVREEHEE